MFHLFIHHLSSLEQNREQSFGLTSNFASDNKLSQENQQKNVLSKILLNDGDSYDVTIPPPDSDEYEKREYFDTAEAKTFKISSSPGNIAILIFKNPKEFTLENGDQIKPFYSSINQNEIILKIKALKLYTSLEYYWQEFTYSPDMYVNIIMNVANFSYEFPQLQNFHLIYAYTQTAEIMHKDIYSDGKSNGGGTLTYEHEIPKGHYFVSVKISDNTISDDVTSGIFNVENCLSAMDYAQKSVLLYPFKLYSLKVDSTPIKYVVCEFGFKHFVVLAKNGIKQVDNHTEDSSYLSSTNGQQDVLALFIPIDSYSFKVKYSVNTISDQVLSYYIEEEEISMMLIYSYTPFTVNMTYYGNATTPISSSFSCKNNNNELLSGDYLHNNNISSCNNTNYLLLSLNKGKIEFSKFSFDNPLISNEGMPQYDDGSLKARWAPKTPEITPEMTPPDNKGNNNNEDDPNNQKNNSGNKLSGGAIVGIVIGVIVVIAVCIAAFIIIRKRKSSSTNTDAGDEV